MLDSEIVAAVVAGEADGLAAAYDRYATPLYAFCCSLLTEPASVSYQPLPAAQGTARSR